MNQLVPHCHLNFLLISPYLFLIFLGVDGLIFWMHKVMLMEDDIVVIDAAVDALQVVITCPSIRTHSCAWLDPLSDHAFQCFMSSVRHLLQEALPSSTLNTTWTKREHDNHLPQQNLPTLLKKSKTWGHTSMTAPLALHETWLANLHHFGGNVVIPIQSQATNLRWVLNEQVPTDTSTHQPPISFCVFCYATTLLVAAKQWILFCLAVDEGHKLCQG